MLQNGASVWLLDNIVTIAYITPACNKTNHRHLAFMHAMQFSLLAVCAACINVYEILCLLVCKMPRAFPTNDNFVALSCRLLPNMSFVQLWILTAHLGLCRRQPPKLGELQRSWSPQPPPQQTQADKRLTVWYLCPVLGHVRVASTCLKLGSVAISLMLFFKAMPG